MVDGVSVVNGDPRFAFLKVHEVGTCTAAPFPSSVSMETSNTPTKYPTRMPSDGPSLSPTEAPTSMPSRSSFPSRAPSGISSVSFVPSSIQSISPSQAPSVIPSMSQSAIPSMSPSQAPSTIPQILLLVVQHRKFAPIIQQYLELSKLLMVTQTVITLTVLCLILVSMLLTHGGKWILATSTRLSGLSYGIAQIVVRTD